MSDSAAAGPGTPLQDQGSSQPWPSDPRAMGPVPLLVGDPPKIGDFWLDTRLTAREAGVVYIGHADDQSSVMLITLSDGAAHDAAARDRLAGEVNKLHASAVVARGGDGQDGGRLGYKYRSEQDDPVSPGDPPLAPWVALLYDGSPAAKAEADRLLRSVDLSATPQLTSPSGPDYRLHWIDNSRPGIWRVWNTPWPGRHDRAGWVPLAVSWALTLLLCGLALLIAVLLFQNSPPESAAPPVPTSKEGSAGNQSGEPSSPESGEPTNGESQSASSNQSGSQSADQSSVPPSADPGEGGSPSKDSSMGAGGEGTATGTTEPTNAKTKL